MNRFIGSKTLRKIFIYVVTTALIMVLSISSILYTDYEKIGLKTVNDYNIRYLGQVSYHISFMLDSVFEYSVMHILIQISKSSCIQQKQGMLLTLIILEASVDYKIHSLFLL